MTRDYRQYELDWVAGRFAALTVPITRINADWYEWGCWRVGIYACTDTSEHLIGDVSHDGKQPWEDVSEVANQLGRAIATQHGLPFTPAPDKPPLPEEITYDWNPPEPIF